MGLLAPRRFTDNRRKRDRIWRYDSYVDLFDEVTGQVEQDATLSGNVHGPVAQVHK